VDTESTGLADNPDAEIVELTWARLDGDPETLYFGVTEVPPFIDDLIGFTKRDIAGRRSTHFQIERFLKASDGQTLVAANPSHDMHFIQQAGLWKFHYRMLDIESYAYAKLPFDFDDVPGMKSIYDTLVAKGVGLTEPDHTSRNDVLAMREAFLYLEAR
jgi:DNA polymerase III alpha subunit (gram-positive type)